MELALEVSDMDVPFGEDVEEDVVEEEGGGNTKGEEKKVILDKSLCSALIAAFVLVGQYQEYKEAKENVDFGILVNSGSDCVLLLLLF